MPPRLRVPVIPANAPYAPVPLTTDIVWALKGLQGGDATKHQQVLALQWIVNQACQTYGLSYRPGEEGRRDTDFAEGKKFVGQQIVKALNMTTEQIDALKSAQGIPPSVSGETDEIPDQKE